MILKALYDYYHRCGDLPAFGLEEKQIGFLLVIDKNGRFLHFEDCRLDNKTAKSFLVKKGVTRSSAPVANFLYDSSTYVFGYPEESNSKMEIFRNKISQVAELAPENEDLQCLLKFYAQDDLTLLESLKKDPLWEDISKNLSKKYSTFSFRIKGDTRIVAEKKELIQLTQNNDNDAENAICLVTGNRGIASVVTTATMIPGSQATAKLVSFQVKSGYDSYGKTQGANAPISEEAEFAYTTALKTLLQNDSRNRFLVGNRTFVFWASSANQACREVENSVYSLFGFVEDKTDDPNAGIEQVRDVFRGIYSGSIKTTMEDKFYILGMAPNAARIAVVYWSEISLRDFAKTILRHFDDMEIVDLRKQKRPYMGLKDMLGAVTLSKKHQDAAPNLPDAIVKSIFQGLPYPQTLFASAIRRIRAEQDLTYFGGPCRVAILKAYLNRLNDSNKKLDIMLDKENTNLGYLCGRLFAVLDKIQYDANKIHGIQERYMNAASATPSAVFATILNLSKHHSEKLDEGKKIFFERLKQEILDKFPSAGFPSHLSLQDQGRFFVGFYHQQQDFYTKKED